MIIGISGKKQHGKDTVCSIIQVLTRVDGPGKDTTHWEKDLESIFRSMPNEDWDDLFVWKRKIFAGKLKETVANMIGCKLWQLEDNDFKNKSLGEEWRRYYITYYKWSNPDNPKGRVSPYFYTSEELLEYWLKYEGVDWLGEGYVINNEILTPRMILQELGTEGMRNIHPNFHVNALFTDYQEEVPCQCEEARKQGFSMMCFSCQARPGSNWIIPDVRFPNEVEAIRKRGGLVIRVDNPRIESNDNHASETALDEYQHWDYKINNDGSIDDLIIKVKDFMYTLNIK